MSLKHAAEGFEPRMRIGVIGDSWATLPENGVFPAAPLDYAELEHLYPVFYRETDRRELEELLRTKTEPALYVQA